MMAGGFIGFGAAASSVAAHQVANTGLSRLAMGAVFPIGLMMIVLVGGELFTGDCLMVTGIWDKRYGIGRMIRVLTLIWFSNLVGSVLIAALVSYSGIFSYSEGGMGAFMIKIAYGKWHAATAGICFRHSLQYSGMLCSAYGDSCKRCSGKDHCNLFPDYGIRCRRLGTLRCKYVLSAGRNFCCA